MRLAVCEQGYGSAVEALVGGNALAAQTATRLAGQLRGYAGMAGNDSTATEFASSYDEAAAASVEALESVVGAFATLGRMVEASLANHAHADARSTLPGWARAVVGPPTAADRAVGVLLAPPPSSLGAEGHGPGGPAAMVLDLLQDVFWPNADTDRLRAAGAVWASAGASVAPIEAQCDAALAALDGERSPEIPVALAVIRDLRDRIGDLAAQLDALGSACYEYADHVDAKRAELLSLLEDLVIELGVTIAVGGALTLLTGGAGGAAASGIGATRLAAAGSRARGILDSLRILTGGSALAVRPVAVTAGEVGMSAGRINGARVVLTEASERGAARGSGSSLGQFKRGFLDAHEGPGLGHTILEHVDMSKAALLQRYIDKPWLKRASTFRNQDEAEAAISRALQMNEAKVGDWLANGKTSRGFSADLGDDIGQVLIKDSGEMVPAHIVRIVLIHDETMAAGWRLLTAYPTL